MKQVDHEKWLDRIDNVIQIQRELGTDIATMRFTRHELIELRLMISTLYNDEIREKIKENTDEKRDV